MDIALYLRVLRRFKFLMALGFLLAAGAAFISFVQVSPGGKGPLLTYRDQEEWISFSELFVTQQGFPWGRTVIEDPSARAAQARLEKRARDLGVEYASPTRFSSLAVLYAHLATSDPVRDLMLEDGPILGQIEAAPVLSDSGFSDPLPLISIAAIAGSEKASLELNHRTAAAFLRFLKDQQESHGIPPENRVEVAVVKRAQKAGLYHGRSFTVPIVAFMTIVMLFSGIAFLLENLRPRVRVLPAEAAPVGLERLSA